MRWRLEAKNMIDFYFSPTPNGWKVGIMLEECGLEYNTILVRLAKGDQFVPAFLAISPNAKELDAASITPRAPSRPYSPPLATSAAPRTLSY